MKTHLNHLRLYRIFLLILLGVFGSVTMNSSSVKAQLEEKTIRSDSKQLFFVDPMVFYSKEKSKARLDIYMEIPLENLQFKKNYDSKMYDANVSYTIVIKNFAGEVVENETMTDYVSTSKEEQKGLEGSSKFIVREFYLNPGKYEMNVTLSDINTKRELTLKNKIDVVDFVNERISFSNIMLISNMSTDNGKKVITPLVNGNVDNLKEFYVFFEVYNAKNDNVINSYSFQITDKNENVVERGNLTYTLAPGINKCFEKIKASNLVYGDYVLDVKDNATGELLAEKKFVNKMTGFPTNAKELDLMIDQLLYIATDDQLSKVESAKTNEEKQKRFIEFWKSKDPSPNTPKNELMIEYYRRIQTANERYSHYIDGWKTDMGMVYIIFGEPDNIERYPFQENTKPYEVWYFYGANKEFVFVDETGFGDYRLTTPIWDVDRHRIRN
jgi:GWxTD domain-containing protein